MKTLMIVTGGLGTGGLERISCFIANSFIEKGWKVVILTLLQRTSDSCSFQSLNKNIIVKNYDGRQNPLKHKFLAIGTWRKMIKNYTNEFNPDCILAMTFKIASMVCLFAPKMSNRVTVREISDPKSKVRNRIVNLLTEFFCRKVKNIIFQTHWEKDCYHNTIKNKGVVIPNPLTIDVNVTGSFKEKKMFALSRLLINQKRQDILIQAFSIFHKEHPDYSLEIYGKGGDKCTLEKLILKYECSDFVKILDPVPNIHAIVREYRCFVLTSDYEGMSNALLECYCSGIPCLSSDWPGVEDIVTNGLDGLIYKRQDIEQLASLMSFVASNDEVCKKMTMNAIQNSERFKSYVVVPQYCEVIERE